MGKSTELMQLLKTGNSDAARKLIAKLKKSGKLLSRQPSPPPSGTPHRVAPGPVAWRPDLPLGLLLSCYNCHMAALKNIHCSIWLAVMAGAYV